MPAPITATYPIGPHLVRGAIESLHGMSQDPLDVHGFGTLRFEHHGDPESRVGVRFDGNDPQGVRGRALAQVA